MKNRDKKARTTLESHYARKRPGKTPHIKNMAQFLKGGKNGHFVKGIYQSKMVTNGLFWDVSLKIPKT